MAVISTSLPQKFQAPEYRFIRAVVFVSLGMWGVVPVTHLLVTHGHVWAIRTAFQLDMLMGLIYLVSVAVLRDVSLHRVACLCVAHVATRAGPKAGGLGGSAVILHPTRLRHAAGAVLTTPHVRAACCRSRLLPPRCNYKITTQNSWALSRTRAASLSAGTPASLTSWVTATSCGTRLWCWRPGCTTVR